MAGGAGEGSHGDCEEAVVDDVGSNGEMMVAEELELRGAGL